MYIYCDIGLVVVPAPMDRRPGPPRTCSTQVYKELHKEMKDSNIEDEDEDEDP